MEALEAIMTRRSIRKYTNEKISKENILILLEAAMQAPSAGNQQPWQFVVVDDESLKKEIADFHPYAKMLPQASCGIVICGDLSIEKYRESWLQDCSAATMNILLAAHSLGIGAVWVGIHPEMPRIKKIREILKLPMHIEPLSLISMGYPAETRHQELRMKMDRIHYNNW